MGFADQLLATEQRIYTQLRGRADRRLALQAAAAGERPRPEHLLTGERGEAAAFFYLQQLGYTVVARRWTAAKLRGDLDLVGWDGDTLIIFEVKTRTARDIAPAQIAVDRDKRNQLRRLGSAYLRRIPDEHRDSVKLRYDVLAIYLLDTGNQFEHYPNYFPHIAPHSDWDGRFRR